MRFLLVLVAALVLSGCAAEVISSSPRTVIVRAGSARAGDAQNAAEAECKKYDRSHARLAGKSGEAQWVFDCVN